MKEPKDLTILIVDDEAALRKALVFDFKRKGFTVLEAENGRDAFRLVRENKIDIVLSDVRMANGDGLELLDNVKQINPELPVVMFLTGFADISTDEAYHRGVDAIFAKPFDRKALLAAVLKATAERRERWSEPAAAPAPAKEFSIALHFADIGSAMQGKVLNLGRGGMFVALDSAFPAVGATVDFHIRFDDQAAGGIDGAGVVRWVRAKSPDAPGGCGIEFSRLSPTCLSTIVSLIESRKIRPYIPKE